jgi:hypothetical protein
MKLPRFTLRTLFVLIAIVGAISAIVASRPASIPLRSSKSEIRVWLLKRTPLGIEVPDLIRIAKEEGLGEPLSYINVANPYDKDTKEVITLGSYQDGKWRVIVEAYWNFGEDRLKEIDVNKLTQF